MDIVQRESAYNTQNMGDPTSGENTFNDTDENKTTKRPPEAPTYACPAPSRESGLKSAIICGSNPLFRTGMLKIT
jgi:hypothetical protein